jgi:hypothetical protein
MVRVLTTQASHTYGVLDPMVIERRDTKFVQASLSDSRNVVMLPQGGYVDRGGSTRKSLCRRKLQKRTITDANVYLPNGGTNTLLVDGNSATTTTTAVIAGDPFIVAEIDLTTIGSLMAIDLLDFSASAADRDSCVKVQYLSGVTWLDFASATHLRRITRTRRFARPPGSANLATNRVRIIITGGAGPGAITLSGLEVFYQATGISDAVVRSWNYAKSINYQFVISEFNIDVFRDGVWKSAIPAPWTSLQVRGLKWEKDYDTAMFFLPATPSRRLVRQGADDQWNMDLVPFENIPLADFGETYSNGVNEVQRLDFTGFTTGDIFELILEGHRTEGITYDLTGATTATRLKTALEALPNVEPGLTVTSLSGTAYTIEFSGAKNAGVDWLELVPVLKQSSRFIGVSTTTKGKKPGEPFISATRGWPAVGRNAQQRLILAGLASRTNTFLATMTGEPFNLDTEQQGAAAALSYDVTGGAAAIRDIFVSRTVILFTDSAPWHFASPTISAEDVPELFRSDAPGIDENLTALSLANAIFYIQNGGQTLIRMTYSELEKNFLGDNASVLSAFLVNNPIDWDLKRATRGNDADMIMYINEDGKLVTLTLMSSQEVSGFAPHETDGIYKSLCVDGEQVVWQIVQRSVRGQDEMVFERMDQDLQLDSATEFAFTLPGPEITGLDDYEGQTLHVWADGKAQGAYVVAGGAIRLPRNVSSGRAGFWTPPFATDPAFFPEEEQQRPMARLKRVFGVDVSVVDTEALAVQVNDGDTYPVPLTEPTTGMITLEGFPGFTAKAQATITQTKPGRLKVRLVKKRIAA